MQPVARRAPRLSIGASLAGAGVAFLIAFLASRAILYAGAVARGLPPGAPQLVTWPMVVGMLAALFVAYLAGGYAAGRIAGRSAPLHGAAVLGWSVLVVIAAAFAYATLAGAIELMAVGMDGTQIAIALGAAAMATLGIAGAGAILGARSGVAAVSRAPRVTGARSTRGSL